MQVLAFKSPKLYMLDAVRPVEISILSFNKAQLKMKHESGPILSPAGLFPLVL